MNGFYNCFQYRRITGSASLHANANLKMLLLRSTGSYAFNPDHDYVADLFSNSAIEITVASYARQALANSTVTLDDTNNRATWDFDNIAFGALETGQTVRAAVLYEHVTNDADSPLICHIDGIIRVTAAAPALASTSGVITGITQANPGVVTDASHGLSTGDKVYIESVGGMTEVNNTMFTVTVVNANSFSIGVNTSGYGAYTSGGTWSLARPVYVEPLKEAISDGTSATIGTGDGIVTGAHALGDRILYLRALDDDITEGETGNIQSSLNFPAPLGGGNFNFNVNASGFCAWNATAP